VDFDPKQNCPNSQNEWQLKKKQRFSAVKKFHQMEMIHSDFLPLGENSFPPKKMYVYIVGFLHPDSFDLELVNMVKVPPLSEVDGTWKHHKSIQQTPLEK